jgi:pantoate--beta-alanine ligase
MGALHDGHLALVREGRKLVGDDGLVAASVFVNPTQFGPNEDFARYPRDLDGDAEKLGSAGCDVLFCPEATAMYPEGERTRVRVDDLTSGLCGPHRPGHFEGVATVVSKLFSLVGRAHAIFGKKDYQQLAVIRRLASDLFFPVTVVGHPIVREPSGLAMSSRNAYLSPEEHERALSLSRGLRAAYAAYTAGERRARELRELVLGHVARVADAIDYVEVAHPDTLAPFADAGPIAEEALVALACRIGKTRLIDNVVLGEDPPESLGAP